MDPAKISYQSNNFLHAYKHVGVLTDWEETHFDIEMTSARFGCVLPNDPDTNVETLSELEDSDSDTE